MAIVNRVAAALLLTAVLTLAMLTLVTIWLSLTAADGLFVGLQNLMSVPRSFLFRRAVLNTLSVAIAAAALVLPLSWFAADWSGRMGRHGLWLLALLLLPLALPAGLASVAWNQLLLPLYVPMQTRLFALGALAVAQAWRLLPFLTVFSLWRRRSSFRLHLLQGLPIVLYLVAVDAGLPLLVTGGAPDRSTHVWAGWLLQRVIVSGNVGQAAAMALYLLPYFCGLGMAIFLALRFPPAPFAPAPSGSSLSPSKILLGSGLVALFLVLPYVALLARSGAPLQWPVLVGRLLRDTPFPWWMANSALLAAACTALAVLGATGGRLLGEALRRPVRVRLGVGLLVAAASVVPLLIVPVPWLLDLVGSGDRRLALLLAYGSLALVAGGGVSLLGGQGRHEVLWYGMFACLLTTQEFSLAAGLPGPSTTLDLTTGVVDRLGHGAGGAAPALALAVLLSAGLLFCVYILLQREAFGAWQKRP